MGGLTYADETENIWLLLPFPDSWAITPPLVSALPKTVLVSLDFPLSLLLSMLVPLAAIPFLDLAVSSKFSSSFTSFGILFLNHHPLNFLPDHPCMHASIRPTSLIQCFYSVILIMTRDSILFIYIFNILLISILYIFVYCLLLISAIISSRRAGNNTCHFVGAWSIFVYRIN